MQAAKRALKNRCLSFLSALKDDGITQQLLQRFREATCMTDRTAALACLKDTPGELQSTEGMISGPCNGPEPHA